MILNTRRNSSPSLSKGRLFTVLTSLGVLGIVAVCAGPRLVLAQAVTPRPAAAVVAASDSNPESQIVASPPAVSAAPAAAPFVAEGEPTPSPTPAVAPGPKIKPENPDQEPPEPADVSIPEPPQAPVLPKAPGRIARAGKPGKAPSGPDLVDDSEGNLSVEARLRRLEKMVQSLMSQQNLKHSHGYAFVDGGNQNFNLDQQSLEKLKQSADRQAARAAEQAQRAAEQAKRTTKDLETRLEKQQQDRGQFQENMQRQIEALRKAREGLGQEMERLDRQIEKLQQEQEHGDKQQQRRSEKLREKLQAQSGADPDSDVAR